MFVYTPGTKLEVVAAGDETELHEGQELIGLSEEDVTVVPDQESIVLATFKNRLAAERMLWHRLGASSGAKPRG